MYLVLTPLAIVPAVLVAVRQWLTPEQVYQADDLRFTRDPFDALIVSAARTLALPLLTRDADIRASGAVHVIW